MHTSRILLLACMFGAACDGEPSAQEPHSVTDSAGVRIVRYATPSDWTSTDSLREQLRIGMAEGPPERLFSSIAGGKILEDGALVLVDAGSREVRRFAADGSFLARHGREGQGPGEYEFITGVGQCAESGFTVFDIGWTMSAYDATGTFVDERTTRLEQGSTPYHMACSRTGRLAAINWDLTTDRPPLGFHVATARLRLLAADGSESADLGERIGSERFGTPTGSGPHPAGRSTRFGFQGEDLVVSDGSFFGFERWTPDGRLTEIVRVDVAPPDVDSLMREYLEWSLDRAPDEETRTRWRRQIAEMEGPQTAGFFSDLLVTDGAILLREPSVGRVGRWFEFDARGRPVGYLPIPRGARLLDVVGDLVLVEERDDLDVPSAVLYRRVDRP